MSEPPRDPAAEAAVLGAALRSPAALTEVAPLLAGEDFYRPAHELIWDAIIALSDVGTGVDPVTVADCMARAGTLGTAGGVVYLHDLVAGVPTVSNAGFYARIVRDAATRRRVLATAHRIAQAAAGLEGTPEDLVSEAVTELSSVTRPDPAAERTMIGDLIDEVIDGLESPPDEAGAVRWPWRDLADTMRPLSSGQLVLFAGRPGSGKSVALVDVARDAALRQGKTVLLHTLEMSREEVMWRILAAEARIPLSAVLSRALTPEHWARLAQARAVFDGAPLHIVDAPNLTTADLRASIDRLHPDLVIVDYVQLGTVNPRLERRVALEEYIRGLKLLAKSSGVPILTAAQLGRGPEMRTDHTPQLSDLRETGSLEQDADAVVLLFRPDYYEPESARAGEVDMIVAKQRNGPTGTVTLCHQLHYSRFVDMAA